MENRKSLGCFKQSKLLPLVQGLVNQVCVQASMLVSGSRLSFKLCREKTGAMLEGSVLPLST